MIIPLCKDCRFYDKSRNGASYDKCLFNPQTEPVRGELIIRYCDMERVMTHDDHCGKSAVNFISLKGK